MTDDLTYDWVVFSTLVPTNSYILLISFLSFFLSFGYTKAHVHFYIVSFWEQSLFVMI